MESQSNKNNHALTDAFERFTRDFGATVDDISTNNNNNETKKRYNRCNKKVGLIGFECRCGDLFCGNHRYPEIHECEFNFKDIGRNILAK
ncbi:hypothetical protein Ahy_A10g047791 [Arachis hypogaea]|uniref:AN1-type domain-containing protein n=1 Tax=Arachis hypogaea TaxID=3818 RepID=A0A445B3H0_ARAHY|nr:hypothetical protein Ahy_A10g047791 [Arachis hypogaea]